MPESQLPPNWGPAYDERDLDALLSGYLADLPEALIPVAGTLAALHARPARPELAGEAAARAAFRRFAQDPASWAENAEPGTVLSHTLVLPRPQSDRPQRHTARHRRRRADGTFRRPLTIGGVAAAVVLVAGVAVAALVPGHHLTPFGHNSASPTAVAKGTGQASQTPHVEITGKPEPIIRPTPATSAGSDATPDPGALCREYYAFWGHPEPKSAWAAELALWRQLSGLAGGQWKVLSFCLPDLDFGPWGSKGTTMTPPHGNDPGPSANEGSSGNGSGQEGSDTRGQAGSAGGQSGNSTGNTPVPGASSTSTASSGSGSGSQSHAHLGDPGDWGGATARLAG